jgi:hypothetical protein
VSLIHGGGRSSARGAFVRNVVLTVALIAGAPALAAAGALTIRWNASPEPEVVGYVVHVGTQPGVVAERFDVGSATTFTYQNAVAGLTYYFSVSSYGAGDLASPRSAEIAVTMPAPPDPVTLVAPAGSLATATPSFTWRPVAGAIGYVLLVNDAQAAARIERAYSSTQAGCTSTACTVAPGVALSAGPGNWMVRASNAAGDGPWSAPMSFVAPTPTADPAPPAAEWENGGFENGYSGWTASGNHLLASGSFWVATEGVNAVAFNAEQQAPTGVLTRTFPTAAGRAYTLTFDLGAISGLNTAEQRMEVTIRGSASLLSRTVSVSAPGNGTRYVPQSFTFVADAASATLTFRDVSATTMNVDLMLDKVNVAPATTVGGDALPEGRMLLARSATNPRYFENRAGEVVYLTGSHTWNSLIDNGSTNPPAPFDFTAYLDFLQARKHNLIRLWAWDHPYWYYHEAPAGYSYKRASGPFPFQRPGPGIAMDGGPRFDLTKFNQAYFDRLRARVEAARARGIYVSIMLFEGWTSQFGDIGSHPFELGNNINGINGDPDNNQSIEVYTLAIPAITAIQRAYVEKVVQTVGDLDNVLFEIANEAGSFSLPWQEHLLAHLRAYEQANPALYLPHPIGISYQQGCQPVATCNAALEATAADWVSISINLPSSTPPPVWNGGSDANQVSLLDTDHVFGVGGDAAWIWKAFLRGHNPIYMDPYHNTVLQNLFADDSARLAMGDARSYAARLDIARAAPSTTVASSGFALVNASARRYLVLSTGTSVTVDLSASTGQFSVEWFDINARTVTAAVNVDGGAVRTLATPGGATNVVAYLVATGVPASDDEAGTGAAVVANGSFEDAVANWTAQGNFSVVSGSFWTASDGTRAIAFNDGQRPANGALSQTLATVAGVTYTLTFDVGAISGLNQFEQRLQATVTGQSGTPLASHVASVFAPGNGTRYVSTSLTFVADGPTTLTFRDVSPSTMNVDLMLDRVQLASGGAR